MKLFSCLGLVVLGLSALMIPSTHLRRRPLHGNYAIRFLNRLLSTTRHGSPRLHRKSSIEQYSIRSGDDKTLKKPPSGTHRLSIKSHGGVDSEGERRFFLSAEGRGRTPRKRAHLKSTKPRNVSPYKSAPSHGASYARARKSARLERGYRRTYDERQIRLRKSKNPSKSVHAGDKQASVKSKKSRKGKMYKKYGFIQAYVPQDQAQLPLSYQQLPAAQNDGASQAGYLPMVTSDQTQSSETEQEDDSNAVPQLSDVQRAAYQAVGGQDQTALFANSDAAAESQQQPAMDTEQLGAQQQVAYAQLSQQQGEGEQQGAASQEGQDQEGLNQEGQNQEGLNQEGLNQEGLNQEGLNQEGLNQEGLNQEGLNQEGQEQQLQQNDAQQEAAQPGGDDQGISDGNSLGSMFSLANQAGRNPMAGEQRLAGYTGEVTSTQQENRDAASPDTTAQYQTSLEAALKEQGINGDNSNSQGESPSIGSDNAHAINIGSDGGILSQDANAAGTDSNNGHVTSPGPYQSEAADDSGNPINAGGNNAGVSAYSPIDGQSLNGEETNFDGASQQQQQQLGSIQSILGAASGQMRPTDAKFPTQPMDDEVYKIINAANANALNHVKGCAGCPPHARCIDKVCIINDDQPLAHILSSLSGAAPGDDTDETNCSACHYNAKCTNNDCVCKPGYAGDGYDCRPDTCLPGCKEHGKCINGFCVCDHHHYFNGHSCSPYKISHHHRCPSHCLKNCSQACPPKCCVHNLKNKHFNGGVLSDGYQVRHSHKPTIHHHKVRDNETNPHENVAATVARPSKAEGKLCPVSCHTQCLDSCPERCCKPCPTNCTTKCHQSCPGHCCDPTEPARPFPSMNANKLQENIFRQIAERFCPRFCTKHCDPSTCPPICCDGLSLPLFPGLKKADGKSVGADVVKNALSWFGMMNLLNIMYDTYGNKSNKTPLTQMSNDAVVKPAGAMASSNGKNNARDNFLLDPTTNTAKCLPTCSTICSPLCPPNCCTKAAATRPVCPPTCKESCSAACSPSCCVSSFSVQPAERPVTGTSHSPGAIRPIAGSSTSAAAPTNETQTAVQTPSATSANPAKTAPSVQGVQMGCSSVCPAYCYPVCSSSCCAGTARSSSQTPVPAPAPAPAPGTPTTKVGRPLTSYPSAHPELKLACPPQCAIWCGPMCQKHCCGATSDPSQPIDVFATIKDKLGSVCPIGCDARCSPSCPEGCCSAAKLAGAAQENEGLQPPITARSCAPQCARWCYPSCERRCCRGAAVKSKAAATNRLGYSNRVSCPSECRPFNCLSYCHHECCLRDSTRNKSDSGQAAYAPRGPGSNLKQRYNNPKVHSGPSATLGSYHLNTKIIKSRGKVDYSLGHKSKRKNIFVSRKQLTHSF